jgi:hypothetical protein
MIQTRRRVNRTQEGVNQPQGVVNQTLGGLSRMQGGLTITHKEGECIKNKEGWIQRGEG